jgi:hypothetical protein
MAQSRDPKRDRPAQPRRIGDLSDALFQEMKRQIADKLASPERHW